ncbi:MAG: ATP-binding protein [Candidatus Omnitrophica bacterium]|nr:ATP-binding protein [Candidatus Omnitrophota bacterium]
MSPKEQILVDPNVVIGKPSKELFISMLTRDISLIDAISDLVDNCMDGAIRLKGRKKFTGLEVNIILTEDGFRIKDNCGGIDKELAQKYAFRFGRPSQAITIDYSVGQFGIGMKRALFKMGNKFEIKSISQKASFSIEIDVNKWSKEESWDFGFKQLIEKRFPLAERGTEIIVSSLNPDVKERFKQKNFLSELKAKLELQHLMHVSKGLVIKINDHPIESNQLKLLNSDKFTTAYWAKRFKMYGNMKVKIYAGIGAQDLKTGGWYVFCNNRLIEGPEQTEVTGWGVKTSVKIPEYHGQFSRFRGFVLFESRLPSFLPWNTSKTSVDTDSPIFQSVKLEMISLMRPIIDFLNKVHDESGAYLNKKLEEKYLQKEIDSASLKDYLDVRTSSKFIAPTQKRLAKKTNEVIIRYIRTEDKVEKLKKFFKISSPKQVGEKTFDYTYSRECKE